MCLFKIWFYQGICPVVGFLVHILLKPGLENFENYFASVPDECSCWEI